MSCIPASHSMNNILPQGAPQLEEGSVERRGSRAYQIFPEVNMNEDADSCDENVLYRRERLPSIVVEPTEHIQLQSDHPGWARACSSSSSLEEETGCGEDAGSSEDKDAAAEPGPGARKSSIGPSQSQLSLSHLTPPTSPSAPDAAPPCLRS